MEIQPLTDGQYPHLSRFKESFTELSRYYHQDLEDFFKVICVIDREVDSHETSRYIRKIYEAGLNQQQLWSYPTDYAEYIISGSEEEMTSIIEAAIELCSSRFAEMEKKEEDSKKEREGKIKNALSKLNAEEKKLLNIR